MNMATSTPLTDEQSTEAAIISAGKTAPRITPADIDAAIVGEAFFTAADGAAGAPRDSESWYSPPALSLLTFCVLVLRNGFTVTGESACASPENFDPQIGRDIARKNAREKIWLLEGYLLKQRLYEASQQRGQASTATQAERMHAAADECMSPEQREAFDEIGKLDPDVYARLFRCVVKRA
jgi:hypothetical protein